MSSDEHHDGDDSPAMKKRKMQRACDICRRKKSQSCLCPPLALLTDVPSKMYVDLTVDGRDLISCKAKEARCPTQNALIAKHTT